MAAKPLTVAVPEPLLKQIRGRARRAKRTVEAEVIQLLTVAIENVASGNQELRNMLALSSEGNGWDEPSMFAYDFYPTDS